MSDNNQFNAADIKAAQDDIQKKNDFNLARKELDCADTNIMAAGYRQEKASIVTRIAQLRASDELLKGWINRYSDEKNIEYADLQPMIENMMDYVLTGRDIDLEQGSRPPIPTDQDSASTEAP